MPGLRQSRINVVEGVNPKNVNWMDLINDRNDSFHSTDLDGQVKVCENVKFTDDHFIQIEKYIDTRNNDIQNEENRKKKFHHSTPEKGHNAHHQHLQQYSGRNPRYGSDVQSSNHKLSSGIRHSTYGGQLSSGGKNHNLASTHGSSNEASELWHKKKAKEEKLAVLHDKCETLKRELAKELFILRNITVKNYEREDKPPAVSNKMEIDVLDDYNVIIIVVLAGLVIGLFFGW